MHSRRIRTGVDARRRRRVDRLRDLSALVALLTAAGAGLWWFWNLGAHTTPSPSPESVLLETLRLAGVGVTGWLLLSALLALAATTIDAVRGRIGAAAGGSRLSLALRGCAAPVVRRLVERALTATILTSVAAGVPLGAVAAGPGEAPPPGVEEPVVRTPRPDEARTPPPSAPPRPVAADSPGKSPAESPVSPQPSDPAVHVIVAGDNLWSVAADHLTVASGAQPGEAEVGAYWARLIDANRSALRSGDPDLVFPGERITLPPTRR